MIIAKMRRLFQNQGAKHPTFDLVALGVVVGFVVEEVG